MEPSLYVQSVIDRNVVMRRICTYTTKHIGILTAIWTGTSWRQVTSSTTNLLHITLLEKPLVHSYGKVVAPVHTIKANGSIRCTWMVWLMSKSLYAQNWSYHFGEDKLSLTAARNQAMIPHLSSLQP